MAEHEENLAEFTVDKLTPKDGDVIVLKFEPTTMSSEALNAAALSLRQGVHEVCGGDVLILCIPNGNDVSLLDVATTEIIARFRQGVYDAFVEGYVTVRDQPVDMVTLQHDWEGSSAYELSGTNMESEEALSEEG